MMAHWVYQCQKSQGAPYPRKAVDSSLRKLVCPRKVVDSSLQKVVCPRRVVDSCWRKVADLMVWARWLAQRKTLHPIQMHFQRWRFGISSGHEGGKDPGRLLVVKNYQWETRWLLLTTEASTWMRARCEDEEYVKARFGSLQRAEVKEGQESKHSFLVAKPSCPGLSPRGFHGAHVHPPAS